ncbi:TIR domain-containing protein [Flavivirga aquimarina]|uniref:TIR domain-containing protein n=1 Tax=Flavivirga aquimarina TaxID=2027862 RepID=A0ABT8W6X1_9FLAO|nr:TIR domain-containing protein [Flavivirga aquimarina]MDO5968868.1 TIR domain-containing protein [Flavivirga aquimarina]
MSFYTKSYLESLTSQYGDSTVFNESVRAARKSYSFDIFLSHSYNDKKYIKGLFYELTKMGFRVYVDWIVDSHLDRSNITKGTVNHIRNRMKQSKSLIYATSDNASKSKWMPWELGYMDGYTSHCSILPITDYEDQTFSDQEFLSVYPYIKKDALRNNYSKNNLRIYESTFSYKTMGEWLM